MSGQIICLQPNWRKDLCWKFSKRQTGATLPSSWTMSSEVPEMSRIESHGVGFCTLVWLIHVFKIDWLPTARSFDDIFGMDWLDITELSSIVMRRLFVFSSRMGKILKFKARGPRKGALLFLEDRSSLRISSVESQKKYMMSNLRVFRLLQREKVYANFQSVNFGYRNAVLGHCGQPDGIHVDLARNGHLRKGRKTKPKRQNRTRNGKAGKRQSPVKHKA
ncbi:hypothetical protein Tco_0031970 [Tanacetum coccineum]